MKATFFTVSALLATAFAAPASVITARAEYDILVRVTDDFSGLSALGTVPSDGFPQLISNFDNVARISKNGFPAGSSVQLTKIVDKIECDIRNQAGNLIGKLNARQTFFDFDTTSPKPVNLSGVTVSCK